MLVYFQSIVSFITGSYINGFQLPTDRGASGI